MFEYKYKKGVCLIMGTMFILAKINVAVQIIEKVLYGIIGIYGVTVVKKYVTDYKDSVEEDKMSERRSGM